MIRPALVRLLLFGLLVSAHLSFGSAAIGQETAYHAEPLAALAEAYWLHNYTVSVRSNSIFIEVVPIGDRMISCNRNELSSIDISFEREPFGSHHIRLSLGFNGKDLSKEITLDVDGEDLKLTPAAGTNVSLALWGRSSTEFELSQEDYQQLMNATTLTIKADGRTFLLTAEHIRALQRFTEAGPKNLHWLFK
jgi:hypothetical protein